MNKVCYTIGNYTSGSAYVNIYIYVNKSDYKLWNKNYSTISAAKRGLKRFLAIFKDNVKVVNIGIN